MENELSKKFTKKKIGIFLLVVLAVILFVLIMLWVFSDDESASECIRPSNTTGYNNITETNLSMGSEFDVSVDCASGYTGTASATACSVAGQAYTLTGCSADSTNSPCSLSTLTRPTNGSWGTTCSSNSGEIQHGASCDLSCNTGYTPSNQPTCNNGELSSTTLTCTTATVEGGASSGNTNPRTCADTDADGSMDNFDCTGSPNSLNSNPAGVTCTSNPCTIAECCTVAPTVAPGTCIRPSDTAYDFTQAREILTMGDAFSVSNITCNPGYGPGDNIVAGVCDSTNTAYTLTGCSDINECDNNPCGEGATCTNNDGGYTCSCGSGYIGDTTDTPCVEKTCSDIDGSNTLADCGDGATCSEGGTGDGYTCTCDDGFIGTTTTNEPAVCTKTCERASDEGIFSCGDGLNIKRNTPCGSNCNNDTCCDYTCGSTLLGDNSIGPITDDICSTYIPNSIFRADSTRDNCSEGGCIDDSGTIKEADYNNCCTGPPFCSERQSICNGQGFSPSEQASATARCDTQNCNSHSDKTACCSEWNCIVPPLNENPGYQVTSPGIDGRPSEVLYSQVGDLSIQCSDGYMTAGSSVPSASVCSGDGLNIQLSGCTTGGGVAEVTTVGESPGEWYVGGGGTDSSNANDRKDCNSFCANRRKVCSENTTAEKFSNEINLATFLGTLTVPSELQTNYNNILTRMRADVTHTNSHGAIERVEVCSGSEQDYDAGVEALAGTGSDTGAQFSIFNNSCSRKLYSGADPDNLIPLRCGDGNYQAEPYRINVCKCRDP
jgi:hypothetical protein